MADSAGISVIDKVRRFLSNKNNLNALKLELKDYFFITLGVSIYALGVNIFMLPYGLTVDDDIVGPHENITVQCIS